MTDGALAAELAGVAAGLCQDAGIGLEVRPGGWSWDPVRRVIRVSAEGLASRGAAYCAGIVAHEVGHFYISRYLSFQVDFPSLSAARTVLNGIEDPRVDRWIVGRYPGAGPWQAHAKVDQLQHPPGTPMFVQFVMECAAEGDRGWTASTVPLPEPVRAALEATREARRAYAVMVPPTDDPPVTPEIAQRYRDEVWPFVEDRWMPHRVEQRVQLSAHDALELAREHILPAAEGLYLRDRHHIAAWLCQHPAHAGRGRQLLTEGRGAQVVGQAMQADVPPRPVPPWAERLASELLDQAASGQVSAPLVVHAGQRPRGRPFDELPWDDLPPLPPIWQPTTDYDTAFAEVSDQVDALVRHLEEILTPQRRSRSRAGYPSGRRVDLTKLMAFEADPRRYDQLWIRTTIPDRRDTAFGLLVDLSGSMHGEKAHHALLGTVLLAETLHRLEVPFAIDGFQDVLIPLHAFGEPLNATTRQRISEMPQEVGGARYNGNNQPGYNDDGPCLLEFSEKVLSWAAADRVLVVVSDGLPEGRRSTKADLHEAVRTLRADGSLRLMGLGLGPDTEHVMHFYPEAVANVTPARFAQTIGQLVEDVLLHRT